MIDIASIHSRLNLEVMQGDHMFSGKNLKHYFYVGASALKVISAVDILANNPRINTILDFACGSGRVTRWLRAAFPAARIVACDVRKDSLQFVNKTFNAETWHSKEDIASLIPPTSFDLIWCGSLLTHLPEDKCAILMNKFSEWLTPGGIAIFTTHGRGVVSRCLDGSQKVLDHDIFNCVLASQLQNGFGYADYPGKKDIGLSLISLEWAERQLYKIKGVRILMAGECLWANHQDVIAIQNRAISDYTHAY